MIRPPAPCVPRPLHRRELLHALLAGLAVGCSVSDRETTDRPVGTGPAFDDPNANAYTPDPSVTTPGPVDEDAAMDLGQRIDSFAFDFYAQLRKGGGNLVYSPASIALAFAMVHAGAKGKTAAELANVFHLDGDRATLDAGFADVLRRWQSSREGLELSVANRLFGEATTPFDNKYLTVTDRVFAAPLEQVDFKKAHEAARSRINILFPFALVLRELGAWALGAMGAFLGIVALGWVYAYREGILDWK